VKVEVRLYDRLFSVEHPGQQEADYKTFLNPNSLRVVSAWVEPSVQNGDKGTRYQFERTGFFWQDPEDSKLHALVFNRIVSLKDSWAKVVQAKETGQSSLQAKHAERRRERDAKKAAQAETDKKRETELDPVAKELCDTHGIGAEQARALSGNAPLLGLFRDAVARGGDAKTTAGLVVTEVARLFKEHSAPSITAPQLSDLARLVQAGDVSSRAAKDVLSEMAKTGEAPDLVVKRLGLAKIVDPSALEPVIDAVLSQFQSKVADYHAGNQNLFGLFVGQVMQRTGGSADPKLVQKLLREKLVP
jgi:glutaminyl-tRNA synthetase